MLVKKKVCVSTAQYSDLRKNLKLLSKFLAPWLNKDKLLTRYSLRQKPLGDRIHLEHEFFSLFSL